MRRSAAFSPPRSSTSICATNDGKSTFSASCRRTNSAAGTSRSIDAVTGGRLPSGISSYPVIGDLAGFNVLNCPIKNIQCLFDLRLGQGNGWSQLENIRVMTDVEHGGTELGCPIGYLGASLAGRLPRPAILDEIDADHEASAAHLADERVRSEEHTSELQS